jgi:hypothetical protein
MPWNWKTRHSRPPPKTMKSNALELYQVTRTNQSSQAASLAEAAWLQVAGAVAMAILSYYTSYDDKHVREMIEEVAYNINLALQKLDEIAAQVASVLAEVKKLPDEFRKILKEQELSEHNTAVQAALIRYRALLHTPPNDYTPKDFIRRQIEDIYNDLVKTTTKLQALSLEGDIQLAPLAGLMVPIAMTLELALLYRLGVPARDLRRKTIARYRHWLNEMLSANHLNNVSAALRAANGNAEATQKVLEQSILNPALTQHDTRQAIYCLEHQIGGTVPFPFQPGKSWAEVTRETWNRIFAIITLTRQAVNNVPLWQLAGTKQIETEWYYRVATTDRWYGPRPTWALHVDNYDSQDLGRYSGQNTAQRRTDIENSPKWRAFVTTGWPKCGEYLDNYNLAHLYQKFTSDVEYSLQSAKRVVQLALDNQMLLEDEHALP